MLNIESGAQPPQKTAFHDRIDLIMKGIFLILCAKGLFNERKARKVSSIYCILLL
jgi:hypothetical protein